VKVKTLINAALVRHQTCKAMGMSSNIIPFRRPGQAPQTPQIAARKTPEERAKALPDWANDLDVAWIFKESDRRMDRSSR